MIRYVVTFTLILFSFINSALALPWFQNTNNLSKQSAQKPETVQNNPINFSGFWAGQCDHNPAVDLLIKHHHNKLSISYGFMEEHYILGEVKSEVRTAFNASEHNNIMVRWSNDNTALIFINSNMFINVDEHLNVFFSKVTMTLNDGHLIVAGHHYQTDGTPGDFNQETMLCSYQKK